MSGNQTLKDRIGVDVGKRMRLEDALEWAGKNQVFYMDVQTDHEPNALGSFDAARIRGVRELCDKHGIHLGLHTLSGMNTAEISPFVSEAADEYLRAYIDLYEKIGAQWMVVHGGYHMTSCRSTRMQASVERLQRTCEYAEKKNALLLLENLNWEPDLAEVHYIPHTPAECLWFFEQLPSPNIKFSFTANHAHFLPGCSIEKFIDQIPFIEWCGEVRLADSNGTYEKHLHPGEGTVDFGAMFKKIEGLGYTGHYTNGWGTMDKMLAGREYMIKRAKQAGVDVW